MKGLYFYKLISPYQEDVTKDCKLTINEIDHNFVTLKNTDIKDIVFDDKTGILTLSQINGDKYITKIDLSHFTRDFNVKWDKENSALIFNYDDKEVKIDEFISTIVDNSVANIVDEIISQTMTDNTLVGVGVGKNPLGINPLEIPGTYKAVERVINKIDGEKLPDEDDLKKGDRFLSHEKINIYGNLYDYNSVKKINEDLKNGWRVPTKEDWDNMLNAIELCNCYKTHSDVICNVNVGKFAGKLLKYNEYWRLNENGEVPLTICEDDCIIDDGNEPLFNPETTKGVDAYGFSILPSGYGDGYGTFKYMGEQSEFWTLTETEKTDVYTKRFYYDKSCLVQIAESPNALCSLRLVKDYDGNNFKGIETINGINYETVLMPSENAKDGYCIWLSSNVSFNDKKYNPVLYNNGEIDIDKTAYYINEWDGFKWLKKRLIDGDSIVIKNGLDGDFNEEYRLVNGKLVNIKYDLKEELLAIVENVAFETNETYISEDIPVIGGPLANFVSGTTQVISAGTNMQDFLVSLFCSEKYPQSPSFNEGSISAQIAPPLFQVVDASNNVQLTNNIEVESGTLINVNALTASKTNYQISNSTWSGFDYGYSVMNDNNRDGNGNPSNLSYSTPKQLSNYYLNRVFKGFDNSIPAQIAIDNVNNTNVNVYSQNNITIADGDNTITANVTGASYSITFSADTMSYYACSNLGKTKDNKYVIGYAHTKETNIPTNVYSVTIKGCRYSFIGVSKTNDFKITSENIRKLSPIAFNKENTNKVIANSGNTCVVIAYPQEWGEIKQIKDVNGMNAPIQNNFEKYEINVNGENNYSVKPYYVYVLKSDVKLGEIDYDIIF